MSKNTWSWLVLPLLRFAIGLSICMAGLACYHGEERFCTNAALRMIETGDYWTPCFSPPRHLL